jgi:hypothetical protein
VRQRYSRLLVLKRLTTAGTVKSEVTVEVGATCLQVQAVDRPCSAASWADPFVAAAGLDVGVPLAITEATMDVAMAST